MKQAYFTWNSLACVTICLLFCFVSYHNEESYFFVDCILMIMILSVTHWTWWSKLAQLFCIVPLKRIGFSRTLESILMPKSSQVFSASLKVILKISIKAPSMQYSSFLWRWIIRSFFLPLLSGHLIIKHRRKICNWPMIAPL